MNYGVKEIIMEALSLAESRDGLGFEGRQAAESNRIALDRRVQSSTSREKCLTMRTA
uniref:Uncharacterized protein n=1 Tax=Triticum urartu TaxID=4572 RepID=A0A8R7QMQ4_TRIUA